MPLRALASVRKPETKRPEDQAPPRRLLNLQQAAEYCGVSYWTMRDYVLAGEVPLTPLPSLRPREGERAKTNLRRCVIDREDLDRAIDKWKRRAAEGTVR